MLFKQKTCIWVSYAVIDYANDHFPLQPPPKKNDNNKTNVKGSANQKYNVGGQKNKTISEVYNSINRI